MSLELESWKHKYSTLADKSGRNITDIEIDKMRNIMLENESILNSEITRLREGLDEWQKRYRILELSLSEARGSEGTIRELEQKISSLRQDLDRQNYQLTAKANECEDYRQKYMRIEQQLRDQATVDIEIRRLKEMIDSRNREIESLRQFQSATTMLEEKIRSLNGDIDRLKGQLGPKDDEIARLRQEISNLELKLRDNSRFADVEARYQNLMSDYDALQQRYRMLQNESNELASQMGQYKS